MRKHIYRSGVMLVLALLILPMLLVGQIVPAQAQGWEPRHQDSGVTLNAAGATFPANFYRPLIAVYQENYGITVNYDETGSGTGIERISNGETDFGGSDVFQDDPALSGTDVRHIPSVMGGITAAFNLPSEYRSLRFSGATLTAIFTNQIKTWDDQRIKDDNPRLRTPLPGDEITVVVRDSGSGTTNNFTAFLERYDTNNIGVEASKSENQWDPWFEGDAGRLVKADGNSGIADTVSSTPGAIGYVEFSYADRPTTIPPRLENQAGIFRRATPASVRDAAGTDIPFASSDDLRAEIIDPSSANRQAYPISAFTYFMIHSEGEGAPGDYDQVKAEATADFIYFVLTRGQRIAALRGYAPLPEGVVRQSLDILCDMTYEGNSVFDADC